MSKELPTLYQQYIHLSRYSRWCEDLGRRETWEETVDRYIRFFKIYVDKATDSKVTTRNPIWRKLRAAILDLDIMPSMRCLMTAGPALEKDHTCAYNCAFLTMNHQNKFSELMHVLLCGTGAGFSVERQYINDLPAIAEEFYPTDTVLKVSDSKSGWCRSFKELISLLYSGQIPRWDLSAIRPAGTPLKTFGGRASGPDPLDDLFKFCVQTFNAAAGRKLNSLEVHDLVCKIADIVVVGGVRRSALISLSNLTDQRMRSAKAGEFFHQHPYRVLANNSVCYTENPDIGIFMDEWKSLYTSKSGERGIFNVNAARKKSMRRDPDQLQGTNPCSEIILRDRQLCNLTEAVIRPSDTEADIIRKVRLAAVLGTFQSMLTSFKFLSRKWKTNCEDERLLGVSLTGIMDNPLLTHAAPDAAPLLKSLREEVINTNIEWANKVGIEQSTATTCIKPSGTVSQLCNTSSGIHPSYAEYYIRRVRNDIKDPITQVLVDAGVPYEVDSTNTHAMVFSFPIKTPSTSVIRNEINAIEQLNHWKLVDEKYCEHKASVTIYVKEHEWLDVGAWVYRNFGSISGVSFLPYSDHVYKQAPYEEITKEEYEEMVTLFPKTIAWEVALAELEVTDQTRGMKELACSGPDSCDL